MTCEQCYFQSPVRVCDVLIIGHGHSFFTPVPLFGFCLLKGVCVRETSLFGLILSVKYIMSPYLLSIIHNYICSIIILSLLTRIFPFAGKVCEPE